MLYGSIYLLQPSLVGIEAAALASALSFVAGITTDTGAGQSDENLAVIERSFDVLARIDVNEHVCTK